MKIYYLFYSKGSKYFLYLVRLKTNSLCTVCFSYMGHLESKGHFEMLHNGVRPSSLSQTLLLQSDATLKLLHFMATCVASK